MEITTKMDDEMGYLHLWKPPNQFPAFFINGLVQKIICWESMLSPMKDEGFLPVR